MSHLRSVCNAFLLKSFGHMYADARREWTVPSISSSGFGGMPEPISFVAQQIYRCRDHELAIVTKPSIFLDFGISVNSVSFESALFRFLI